MEVNKIEMNKNRILFTQTSDACANMIVGIRQLRLSVLDLFSTLADGGPDPHRHQHPQVMDNQATGNNRLYHQQAISSLITSHSLCTSSVPPIKVQKHLEQQHQQDLIQYVNATTSTLAATLRSLDHDMVILMQNNHLINTGESVHLGIDYSPDKHNLYMDLCQSYKTYAKLQEYSSSLSQLIQQQSLKRNHRRAEPTIGGNQPRDHRPDSFVATFNPYMYKQRSIGSFLEAFVKTQELMEGFYSQPFGLSTGVFQVSVNKVLKAILVTRGIAIDTVIVKAYHESFASKATKGSAAALLADAALGNPFVEPGEDIDLWSESRYAVFRRLTHHANAAVLHFQYPSQPEIALRSFMVSTTCR